MHVLYYCMEFISVIGICEYSLAFASCSGLMSKFSELVCATLILWVQKGHLQIWLEFNLIFMQVCTYLFLYLVILYFSMIYFIVDSIGIIPLIICLYLFLLMYQNNC